MSRGKGNAPPARPWIPVRVWAVHCPYVMTSVPRVGTPITTPRNRMRVHADMVTGHLAGIDRAFYLTATDLLNGSPTTPIPSTAKPVPAG